MGPPLSAEAREDLRMESFSRRCFFSAIRLWRTSEPQVYFYPGKRIEKVKVGKPFFLLLLISGKKETDPVEFFMDSPLFL